VATPEGIEFTLFPAGPLIRSCAWGIDLVIQWFMVTVIATATHFFAGFRGAWGTLLLFFCIDWFYHVGWEIFCQGQSPGKRLMGIRVAGNDGSPVNPGASLLRNLLRFADTFLFLCPVALVTMLASRAYRRLGDWTAGTLVVYTAQSLSASALSPGAPGGRGAGFSSGLSGFAGLSGLGPAASGGGEEKQAILMFARRYSLLGKARANEIAGPYVEALRDSGGPETPETGEPLPAADYLLAMSRRLQGDR
jgi:uncharacterized RDD family membrane protein YckC